MRKRGEPLEEYSPGYVRIDGEGDDAVVIMDGAFCAEDLLEIARLMSVASRDGAE